MNLWRVIKITVYARDRGHLIYLDDITNVWKFADNQKPVEGGRPCRRCGRWPTKEGYDACLGYISGAKHACCGHGVEEGFIKKG